MADDTAHDCCVTSVMGSVDTVTKDEEEEDRHAVLFQTAKVIDVVCAISGSVGEH